MRYRKKSSASLLQKRRIRKHKTSPRFITYFSYKKSRHTPFFRRKVCQRTSLKYIILFWRKFLRFQRTFYKKFFGWGLGQTPQLITNIQKNAALPRFLICHYMLELRSNSPSLTFPHKKGKPNNFAQKHHFILEKLLRLILILMFLYGKIFQLKKIF